MVFENIKSLLVTGLIAVVLILCASSNFYTEFDYGSTQAQILDIQYDVPNYKLTVSYSIDGTNYNGTLVGDFLNDKVGDLVTINYEKKNYNNIVQYTNKTKMAIYSSLGGLAFLILSYFAFIQFKKDVVRTEKFFE